MHGTLWLMHWTVLNLFARFRMYDTPVSHSNPASYLTYNAHPR